MTKVVVPDLVALGYDERKTKTNGVVLRFNHPISVAQGRETKTIFADVVVFVHEAPVIVVDAKNPRSYLTDNDREQVISYARLLPDIAPYAALCNGGWRVFDAIQKRQISTLPSCKRLLHDLQQRRLTDKQRKSLVSQATRTLFAIESVRELSRLMRRAHDVIRNLKGYDPTKAFDELSKVLFAKMYEEREVADGRRSVNRFTSDSVKELRAQGVEIIQTLWRDTISSDRYREVFSDEEAEKEIALPPEAIDKIVSLLEDKSLGLTDLDVKGVAFEEFLSATYRGGGLGQYFTPREVVNFMVDLVEPAIGERTIDPSCGTGGFLIRTYDVVSEKIRTTDLSDREKATRLKELANEDLVGIDWETRAARTCKMNMIIHGDGHAGVYQANALDLKEVAEKVGLRRQFYPNAPLIDEGAFDIVLTNPPFGAKDETPNVTSPYILGRTGKQKREVLLLERHVRLLRPGGRIAVVIPEGILSNKNDNRIREYLRDECIIRAVIRLPQDAFRMSEGAACTSVLYAVKKDPDNPTLSQQGAIFFARAEYIGTTPAGKPIPRNDLLTIRDAYRSFEAGMWDGIELRGSPDGKISVVRDRPGPEERVWYEPKVNRTSLLYDQLCYVLRDPEPLDRFSYTYCHPEYYRTMETLQAMEVQLCSLESLCVTGYPSRGRKPSEESTDGIPILKVRNITGRGIDLDTEFAVDSETVRTQCGSALLQQNDILITSTGEGTIGRVEPWPYGDPAIADGHISIVRLRPDVHRDFVVEFLRSEVGQIQMLRHVSGSTGQTELLIDHVKTLLLPLPSPETQSLIAEKMKKAREAVGALAERAGDLMIEGDELLARARSEMARLLSRDAAKASKGGRPEKPVKLPSGEFDTNLDALLAVPHKLTKRGRK